MINYIKTLWKNRVVEKPRTFNMVENQDGTITLIPEEGIITEAGTPVDALYMNNIENGILAAAQEVNTINNSISTIAAPNKILKLNAQSKLPASITGDAATVDGKNASDFILVSDKIAPWTLGDIEIYKGNSTVVPTGSYGIIFQYKLYNRGALRISFQLDSGSTSDTVFGQIYKNGIAIGTERSTNSTSGTTFTEDFNNLEYGDVIQLYAYRTNNTSIAGYVGDVAFKKGGNSDYIERI